MIVGRYIFLLSLLLVFSRESFSQPTCFTDYDASSYCQFARSSTIIAVGTVKSLTPAKGDAMLRYSAAEIAVGQVLKGRIGSRVTVELPSHCYGNIENGSTYIFNIDPITGSTVLRAHHWGRLDRVSPKRADELLDGLRSVLAGVRQPRLVGAVTRPNGDGFGSVKVTAANDTSVYSTVTNSAGLFTIAKLPKGRYRVSAGYPPGFQPSDYYDEPRENDDREVEIRGPDEWRCSESIAFGTALSSKITGFLEIGSTNRQKFPYFQLVEANYGKSGDDPTIKMESYSYPPRDDANGPIGFKFFHVPAGRYLLRYAFDRSFEKLTTFYYPGVRGIRNAKVIEIGLGTVRELSIRQPGLGLITITGTSKLADGTPIFGGVNLVDRDEPTVSFPFSPADRDRDDIRFVFRSIKGRPFYLCAGYDGVWHGKQVRMYGKVAFDGETDQNDVVVPLDKPIPAGVYWWDQCRKDS